MAALGHEGAQLGLLVGVQAVVEIGHRGDHLGPAALHRLGLAVQQGLGLGAVELSTRNHRLQLGTRLGATAQGLALGQRLCSLVVFDCNIVAALTVMKKEDEKNFITLMLCTCQ